MLIETPRTRSSKIPAILLFIGGIWAVFFLTLAVPSLALESYGVVPRTLYGLVGIAAMPFLHDNFYHLLSNTIPLHPAGPAGRLQCPLLADRDVRGPPDGTLLWLARATCDARRSQRADFRTDRVFDRGRVLGEANRAALRLPGCGFLIRRHTAMGNLSAHGFQSPMCLGTGISGVRLPARWSPWHDEP